MTSRVATGSCFAKRSSFAERNNTANRRDVYLCRIQEQLAQSAQKLAAALQNAAMIVSFSSGLRALGLGCCCARKHRRCLSKTIALVSARRRRVDSEVGRGKTRCDARPLRGNRSQQQQQQHNKLQPLHQHINTFERSLSRTERNHAKTEVESRNNYVYVIQNLHARN